MESLSVRVIRSNLVRVIRINSIILDLQPASCGESPAGRGAAVTRGFGPVRNEEEEEERGRGAPDRAPPSPDSLLPGQKRLGKAQPRGGGDRPCWGGGGCQVPVKGTPTTATPVTGVSSPPHHPPTPGPPGLVPEPALQGAADEAAERAGRPPARFLPQPTQDAAAGGPAGARGAHPQRALLLLRRWVITCYTPLKLPIPPSGTRCPQLCSPLGTSAIRTGGGPSPVSPCSVSPGWWWWWRWGPSRQVSSPLFGARRGGNSPLLPDGFADRAVAFRCPRCWPGALPAGDPRDRAGAPPKPLARFPRQPCQPGSLPSGPSACVLPSLCLSLSARLSERVLRPWKQLRFLPARTSFVSSADPRGSPFRALLGAVRHSPGGHGSPPARTSPLQ